MFAAAYRLLPQTGFPIGEIVRLRLEEPPNTESELNAEALRTQRKRREIIFSAPSPRSHRLSLEANFERRRTPPNGQRKCTRMFAAAYRLLPRTGFPIGEIVRLHLEEPPNTDE